MTQDERFLKAMHIKPDAIEKAPACPRCGATCGPLVRSGRVRCRSCGVLFRNPGAAPVACGRGHISGRQIEFRLDGEAVILSRADFAGLAGSNQAAVCEVERLLRKLRWHYGAWILVLAAVAVWLVRSVMRG